MLHYQESILSQGHTHSQYIELTLKGTASPQDALYAVRTLSPAEHYVLGLGADFLSANGVKVPYHAPFPALDTPAGPIPATQHDLALWVKGSDAGDVHFKAQALLSSLNTLFDIAQLTIGFQYREGRDLSGYIDGTENPTGEKAIHAAIAEDGSSYLVLQKWQHDLPKLHAMPQKAQDDLIGRHQATNEEFDSAPPSAHVKRTAQESFEPEAFLLRRSMPWTDYNTPDQPKAGLMFTAFGQTPRAFCAQMDRMAGRDDDIVDGVFQYSTPISGAFYWCPPIKDTTFNIPASIPASIPDKAQR